jgi:anti-sigma factor RsiW
VATTAYICESENIAAYIEGDLDPTIRGVIELHFKECPRCASELQQQRQFMCELDSALARSVELAVPPNFAQVVAVHAASDMRGVRDSSEHARALRYCVVLGLAAFALLGFASSKAVVLSVKSAAAKVFAVFSFFAEAAFNALTSAVLIARVVSHSLFNDSRGTGLAALLFVVLALIALSRLIARYHRTRLLD